MNERYASGGMALTFPVFRMRCGLPLTRVASSALLIVLMLEALPADAFAQSRVCHAIRRGESATQAARRMTGNGRNAYQAWFQIMNASSRFVPKSQYDRIHAGWRACVITPAIPSVFSNANHGKESEAADVSEAPAAPAFPSTRGAHGIREPGAALEKMTPAMDCGSQPPTSFEGSRVSISRCCGFALAMVVPWLGWRTVDDYLARRKTASIIVGYFADRFVDEFERPLVRYDVAERPVRARLRHGARRGDSTFFSRQARAGVIRTCRTTRRTSNTTWPG